QQRHRLATPGLSLHDLGEEGGSEAVTLLASEMPSHAHTMRAAPDAAESASPDESRTLSRPVGGAAYQTNSSSNMRMMAGDMAAPVGSNTPHNNMQPYLTLNFCIALQGVFPPRS